MREASQSAAFSGDFVNLAAGDLDAGNTILGKSEVGGFINREFLIRVFAGYLLVLFPQVWLPFLQWGVSQGMVRCSAIYGQRLLLHAQ